MSKKHLLLSDGKTACGRDGLSVKESCNLKAFRYYLGNCVNSFCIKCMKVYGDKLEQPAFNRNRS